MSKVTKQNEKRKAMKIQTSETKSQSSSPMQQDRTRAVLARSAMKVEVAPVLASCLGSSSASLARSTHINPRHVLLHLRRRRKVTEQEREDQVSDNRGFVLEIVEKTKTLAGKVPTNHGHREVGTVATTEFGRKSKTEVTALIGNLVHLVQQLFPFRPRKTALVKVGTGPLATVVKEAVVVVGHLDGHDLFIDKFVEFDEVVLDVLGDREEVGGAGRVELGDGVEEQRPAGVPSERQIPSIRHS